MLPAPSGNCRLIRTSVDVSLLVSERRVGTDSTPRPINRAEGKDTVPDKINKDPYCGFLQLIALLTILLPVFLVAVIMILATWLSASQIIALCPVILAALAGGGAAARRRPRSTTAPGAGVAEQDS